MAELRIIEDDASGQAIGDLIAFHRADAERLSPPESVHALTAGSFDDPALTLYSAWLGNELVGCGALKQLAPGHCELKTMRVVPARLRQGFGEAILLHLLEQARRRGFSRVSLETGRPAPFAAARALYAKHGFAACPAFGDYRDDEFSLCMTRTL